MVANYTNKMFNKYLITKSHEAAMSVRNLSKSLNFHSSYQSRSISFSIQQYVSFGYTRTVIALSNLFENNLLVPWLRSFTAIFCRLFKPLSNKASCEISCSNVLAFGLTLPVLFTTSNTTAMSTSGRKFYMPSFYWLFQPFIMLVDVAAFKENSGIEGRVADKTYDGGTVYNRIIENVTLGQISKILQGTTFHEISRKISHIKDHESMTLSRYFNESEHLLPFLGTLRTVLEKFDYKVGSLELAVSLSQFFAQLNTHLYFKFPIVQGEVDSGVNSTIGFHKLRGSSQGGYFATGKVLQTFKSENSQTCLLIFLRLFLPDFLQLINDKLELIGAGQMQQNDLIIRILDISLNDCFESLFSLTLSERGPEPNTENDDGVGSRHQRDPNADPLDRGGAVRTYSTFAKYRRPTDILSTYNFVFLNPLTFQKMDGLGILVP